MSKWVETPFAELLVDSKDGEWGVDASGIGLTECSIVRGTDFPSIGGAAPDLPRRWIANSNVGRKRLQAGDIILETAGGTSKQSTGRSALVRKKFLEEVEDRPVLCASFCRHLRLDSSRFDSVLIYYMLQTLHQSGYMAVFNIQHTGVSRFQYTSFKNHTALRIPSLPDQRKIAAILSGYDELIENNRRRIALLEKLAEEIYREWFVRFRFPGHEKVKSVRGVPDGFTAIRFAQFCQLQRGFDLPDAQVEPGAYPVIASTSIKTHHAKYRVEPPVIATGRSGSLGTVQFVNQRAWPLNTALFVKNFFGNSPLLVYYVLKGMRLENFNSGAGVPSLNRNHLSGLPMLVPNRQLQTRFDDLVSKMRDQGEVLLKANDVLIRTRDMLLPRLISGKLSVEHLDIRFPPGMAETAGG